MSQFPFSWLVGLLVLTAVAVLSVVLTIGMRRLRVRRRELWMAAARREFHLRREWLEVRFLALASSSGLPRGLAWVGCDFADGVCFARDRATGNLRALVAVTIQFKAIEGGGMEDVQAVKRLRAGTAVFQYEGRHWETTGRAVFNLNPDETIRHFQHELEAVVD